MTKVEKWQLENIDPAGDTKETKVLVRERTNSIVYHYECTDP